MSTHVLVVEDDPDLRTSLAELLHGAGYESVLAANGAEAITCLEGRDPPCVVLVDLLMPGIVGQELLEYLHHDTQLASIPVAIISASPQLAPEGYVVFRKPLDPVALLDFVRASATGPARA